MNKDVLNCRNNNSKPSKRHGRRNSDVPSIRKRKKLLKRLKKRSSDKPNYSNKKKPPERLERKSREQKKKALLRSNNKKK